jgi:hypothetical protein
MMVPRRMGLTVRLVVTAALIVGCAGCFGFVSRDPDPAIQYPAHIIDQAILLKSSFSEESVSRAVKERFETLYFGPRTAQGLKDFLEKHGDRCDVRERIVCIHEYRNALYAFGFVLWLEVSKSEVVVEDFVVRLSFPKEGDDVIPAMTVETEKTTIVDRF